MEVYGVNQNKILNCIVSNSEPHNIYYKDVVSL